MRTHSIAQFVPSLLVLLNVGAFLGVSEVLACSVQKRMHPTSDNIPTITDPDFILKPPGDIVDMGPNFYSSLALTDTVIIGVAEGERHEMLGSVGDIEVDADGRIFVLDHELGEVLLYSSDGSYLGFFGGKGEGQGPGELQQPRELALSESGRKAVVLSLNHIQVFERQENGQFLYRNSFPYTQVRHCSGIFCWDFLSPILQGFSKGSFTFLISHFGVFFFGAFGLGSPRIISNRESQDLEDLTLEWFEVLVLFEQDTVGFILWKHRGHPHVLIEFDLECSPAFVNLFRA